jgi:hypothetical protein
MKKTINNNHSLDSEKLDDAVLAMLSLGIIDDEIGSKPGIQAEPGFDYDALERLHAKGFLAAPPHTLSDRPVWLTPEGARHARELFRKMFCN